MIWELQSVAASHGRHGQIRPLGEGMDFSTFLCDDLVLRVPKRAEVAELVDAEYQLLIALPSDLPLLVPRPIAPPFHSGSLQHVLVYPAVPGTPMAELSTPVDPVQVGAALGGFLRHLHELEPQEVAPAMQVAMWASEARVRIAEVVDVLGAELTGIATNALEQTLPRVRSDLVMCHRDLSDDHVLVDRSGHAIGIIDFGDAGPSPWWHDLVGIWMWGGEAALARNMLGLRSRAR